MKKILFTIQWYPSVFSANALCDQKIIDILSLDQEYKITCLVYCPTGKKRKETINNVKVVRFNRSWWWNVKINAKCEKYTFSKFILRLDKLLLRLTQFVTIPIYPITEPIAYWKFEREAIKLMNKEHFDIVVSEYHGLDSLHAGSILKKRFPEIRFVAILWDPFTGKDPVKYLPKRFFRERMNLGEQQELEVADKIIVMESSRAYHEIHSVCKPYYNKFEYLDIPSIVKPPVQTHPAGLIIHGKINVVYAGILSLPDRNPEYVIQLLKKSTYAKDVNFIFLCTGEGKEKLEQLSNDFPGIITISGFVGREDLNNIYHEAEVLLNFGGPNPSMVPSKIFEYMSYGKPILSTYYIDNEASLKYLRKYPLALCVDQRLEIYENVKLLDNFFEEKISKIVEFDEIEQMFPKNIPTKYVDVIKNLD